MGKGRLGWLAVASLLLVASLGFAACGDSESPGISIPPDASLPEVTAPEEPAPEEPAPEEPAPEEPAPEEPAPEEPAAEEPAAEEPAADSTDEGIPTWGILLIILALFGLVAFIAGRSGGKSTAQPQAAPAAAAPAGPDWRSDARTAYAEGRWLYDAMDAPLATWRGDSLYEAGQPGAGPGDPAQQGTWDRLPARMGAARDALYRVESAAPSSSTAQLATVLVTELNSTRAGVDRLAETRRARRAADDDPAQDADAARSAELVATDGLAEDRRRLSNAIVQFSSAL